MEVSGFLKRSFLAGAATDLRFSLHISIMPAKSSLRYLIHGLLRSILIASNPGTGHINEDIKSVGMESNNGHTQKLFVFIMDVVINMVWVWSCKISCSVALVATEKQWGAKSILASVIFLVFCCLIISCLCGYIQSLLKEFFLFLKG